MPLKYMTAKIREKLQSQFHNNNNKYKNKQKGQVS